MKRNLTIQLDETVIKKARIVAAKRSTSISRLVTEEIEKAAAKDDDYERAKKAAFKQMEEFSLDSGGRALPSRESLHER